MATTVYPCDVILAGGTVDLSGKVADGLDVKAVEESLFRALVEVTSTIVPPADSPAAVDPSQQIRKYIAQTCANLVVYEAEPNPNQPPDEGE